MYENVVFVSRIAKPKSEQVLERIFFLAAALRALYDSPEGIALPVRVPM